MKAIIRNRKTQEQIDFWDLVEATAKDVRNNTPSWKRIRQNTYQKYYYTGE